MTYTYKTPTPHGRCRDLLVDEMLRKAEEEAEKAEKDHAQQA